MAAQHQRLPPFERWQLYLTGALALVGIAGLAVPRSGRFRAARALLALGALWPTTIATGEVGAGMVIVAAAAVVAYAMLLPGRLAQWYPVMGTASFVAMGLAAPSYQPLATTATHALLLLGAGNLAWLLGATSRRLARQRAEAETQARLAQGRFQVAFANASSGMAMVGLDGRVSQANQALSDFVRLPVAELDGAPWLDLVAPDERGSVQAQMEQLLAAEIWSFQRETRFVGPEGWQAWGLLGASLVTDDGGEPLYIFVHVQDITERTRTEQRLRVREEHYRNMFGRSPVAIWELDCTAVGRWLDGLRGGGVTDLAETLGRRPDLVRDGVDLIRVVDVNDAAVALTEGLSRADLTRGLPPQMLTDSMLGCLRDQFVAVWEGRDRVESSVTTRTLRNRRIDVIVHWVAPAMDGRLDLSKVVAAFADVTEYRRTQEALRRIEERLRTVVSAAPIVLFALDRNGVLTLAEGEGLAALRLRPRDAVGRSIFELFRDSPDLVRSVRRALAGESFTTSIEVRQLDFDTRFTPLRENGAVVGVVAVANDVTERKRASQRLEQLIKSKDEFVASVSHELRTPLTAVVGFAQELRDNLAIMERGDIEFFVNLIAEQSLEVADLVEDLLVAARVDLGQVAVSPEPVVVREQLDSVLSTWPAADAASVEIEEQGDKAFADPIRLRQILRNLLSNANRYGGDTVRVRIESDRDEVRIQVMDDGPGISDRDRERIFEPYNRAHRPEGQPAAVGLGLTVSRQLAVLMEGKLEYRYEGGFSIFELSLPSVG